MKKLFFQIATLFVSSFIRFIALGEDVIGKQFVELGTLLDEKPEIVKSVLTGTDEAAALGLLNKYKENNVIYKKADFETFQTNLKSAHVSEIAKLAKEGKAPPEIYSTIMGAVLEKTTKELASEYGITETVTTLKELFGKVAKKDVSADKIQKDFDQYKLDHLKSIKDKDDELSLIKSSVNNTLTEIKLTAAFESFPLDYEERVIPLQRDLLKKAVLSGKEMKYDGDRKRVLFYENGNVMKNPTTLEPLSEDEVIRSVATAYGFKVKGSAPGRGDGDRTGPPTGSKQEWIKNRQKENYTKNASKGQSYLSNEDYTEMNKLFPNN